MGRLLLLTALLLAAACDPGSPPGPPGDAAASAPSRPAVASRAGDAGVHGDIACAACHRGGLADRGVAAVPRAACAASGCHRDAGPAEVTVAGVTFPHRGHGGEESVAMACAGCHSHPDGSLPLSAGTDACGLCHADRLGGERPQDCRLCHRVPEHRGVTSQGVPVPHEGMPWIEGECVRCHYDVAAPGTGVSPASCADCHRALDALTERSIGQDLHPAHTEVSCRACHGENSHRIVTMSSAVSLECSDCHPRIHGVDVDPAFPGSDTCTSCHRTAHAVQQRLVLGVVPGHDDANPSEKFVAGLTCRSCHVAGPAIRTAAVAGSDVACSGCHRAEYATVLRWWSEGTEQRLRRVEAYLRSTEARIPEDAPAEARAAWREGQELLTLVREGRGAHNLPLSHRLLTESLGRAEDAVRRAGRTAPEPPELGREPRMGLCTYCHYRMDDPWQLGEMSDAFHRDVLRGR